jgi:predicted nucleotide-binding protein
VKRYIFIGSSSEALEKARHIREILSHDDDLQAALWTDVFDPGSLTLEALEDMLRKCCAAVFIASPDDETILRDQDAPRQYHADCDPHGSRRWRPEPRGV